MSYSGIDSGIDAETAAQIEATTVIIEAMRETIRDTGLKIVPQELLTAVDEAIAELEGINYKQVLPFRVVKAIEQLHSERSAVKEQDGVA